MSLVRRRRLASVAALFGFAAFVAACAPGASPSPSPSPPPSPSPSPAADGVVVTVRVAGSETYKILLTEPADIAVAHDLLAGREAPRIPNGKVIRGSDGGVNIGYSWHIDPNDVEWADVTVEVCDGRPSDVESGTITSDRFCPWSAEVVAVEPAP